MNEQKFSDTERVNALRHLCEKASPGPWKHSGYKVIYPVGATTRTAESNAAFSAHARQGVPYLLDLVDRYETMRNDALQIIVEFASGEYDSTGRCMEDISTALRKVFI